MADTWDTNYKLGQKPKKQNKNARESKRLSIHIIESLPDCPAVLPEAVGQHGEKGRVVGRGPHHPQRLRLVEPARPVTHYVLTDTQRFYADLVN